MSYAFEGFNFKIVKEMILESKSHIFFIFNNHFYFSTNKMINFVIRVFKCILKKIQGDISLLLKCKNSPGLGFRC